MNISNLPEIIALNKIYSEYNVSIRVSKDECLGGNLDYPAAVFTIKEKSFNMYINDELSDLQYQNPLLNLYLVLRELDYFSESPDVTEWCMENGFDESNDQVLGYYRDLGSIYRVVEKIIGKINPIISDYDYEMGSGVACELRKITKLMANKKRLSLLI